MAFRIGELDGKVIVVIDDPKLAAAVRSLGYAWQEAPHREKYVGQIVAFLTGLYATIASGCIRD